MSGSVWIGSSPRWAGVRVSAWSGGGQQRKGDVDRNIQEDTGGSSGRLIFADVSCINGRGLRFKADLLLFDPSPRLTRQGGIVCTQHPSALAGTGRWGGRGLGFVFWSSSTMCKDQESVSCSRSARSPARSEVANEGLILLSSGIQQFGDWPYKAAPLEFRMRNKYLGIWIVRVLFDKEEFGVLIGVKICFDTSSHYSVLTRDDHIRKHPSGLCEPH